MPENVEVTPDMDMDTIAAAANAASASVTDLANYCTVQAQAARSNTNSSIFLSIISFPPYFSVFIILSKFPFEIY